MLGMLLAEETNPSSISVPFISISSRSYFARQSFDGYLQKHCWCLKLKLFHTNRNLTTPYSTDSLGVSTFLIPFVFDSLPSQQQTTSNILLKHRHLENNYYICLEKFASTANTWEAEGNPGPSKKTTGGSLEHIIY